MDQRHEQRDHDEADDQTEHDDHDWFKQTHKTFDSYFHFFIIHVGNFVEHVVQCSCFFPDVHHVDHHFIYDFGFSQRHGDGFPFTDGRIDIVKGSHEYGIACCITGNQKSFQNRYTRSNQCPERARDSGNRADVQNLAYQRDT